MKIAIQDDDLLLGFDDTERHVLTQLLAQLIQLLGLASHPGMRDGDPALAKLTPIGSHDEEQEREFRTLTLESTISAKRSDAERCQSDLESGDPMTLDEPGALAWVRTLGAIRIVLHERLTPMRAGEDEDITADDLVQVEELSEWLGYTQSALVDTLSAAR